MLFNGVKKQNKFFLIILLSIFSFVTFANEGGIPVPGQLQIDSYDGASEEDNSEDEKKEHYTLEQSLDEYNGEASGEEGVDQFAIPNQSNEYRKLTDKEKILSTGVTEPYKFENDQNYLSLSHSDIFKKVYDKGEAAISFTYLKDEFDVTDPDGIYQKTFDSGGESMRAGYLLFASDHYFYKGFVNLFWTTGVGVSYSKGKGVFLTSQSKSNATFTLYTAPIDLGVGLEIPLGKVFNLYVAGGASAMALYQNRSDKDQGEAEKRKRQISPGYYVNAKLKISLANLLRSTAFTYFSEDKITNYYLNLEMRQHSYTSFQDPLEVSGSSVGLGFSFDYL